MDSEDSLELGQRRGRVLLASSDREEARALALLLSACDYDAQPVFDGVAALEVARRWRPDMVVLSLDLPYLNGYQVAAALRHARSATTTIALLDPGVELLDRHRCFDFRLRRPASSIALFTHLHWRILTGKRPPPSRPLR